MVVDVVPPAASSLASRPSSFRVEPLPGVECPQGVLPWVSLEFQRPLNESCGQGVVEGLLQVTVAVDEALKSVTVDLKHPGDAKERRKGV